MVAKPIISLLLLTVLSLAGCRGNAGVQPAPNLRTLGLHMSDLPSETSADGARSWSNTQAARRERLRSAMRTAYVLSTNTLGTNAGQTGIHVPFRQVAIPPVGNEDATFTADWGGDEFAYTTRVIIFRRGRYVVLLRIRGLQDQTALSKVVAVARTIDARVKAAD